MEYLLNFAGFSIFKKHLLIVMTENDNHGGGDDPKKALKAYVEGILEHFGTIASRS